MSYHRRCCCPGGCFNGNPCNYAMPTSPATLTLTFAGLALCAGCLPVTGAVGGSGITIPFRLKYLSGTLQNGSFTLPVTQNAIGSCTAQYIWAHDFHFGVYSNIDTSCATQLSIASGSGGSSGLMTVQMLAAGTLQIATSIELWWTYGINSISADLRMFYNITSITAGQCALLPDYSVANDYSSCGQFGLITTGASGGIATLAA